MLYNREFSPSLNVESKIQGHTEEGEARDRRKEVKRTGGEKFKTEKKRRTKGRKDQKYLDNSIVESKLD